jgi:hypothetical protein
MVNVVVLVARPVAPKPVMANVVVPVARPVVPKPVMANAVVRVARPVVPKPVMVNGEVLVVRRDANVASAKQGNAKVVSVAREAKVAVGPRRAKITATRTATTTTSRSRLLWSNGITASLV